MAELSPLRRRMIEDMSVRNLAPTTQQSYVHHVAKFSRYFGRSPERLGLAEVHEFQVHLVSQQVSWAGLNQAVCALRFFFGVTLGTIRFARADPLRAATSSAAGRVERATRSCGSWKLFRAFATAPPLTTAYAAGLRAAEAARLKIADIDSGRGVIRVEHGKGGKDRYVMLSPQLLNILRIYWGLARPKIWLFPGRDGNRPVDPQAGQPNWRQRLVFHNPPFAPIWGLGAQAQHTTFL